MHVKTKLTKKDVLHMNLYLSFRMKSNLYSFILLFVFFLVLGLLNIPIDKETSLLAITITAALGAVVGWIAGFIVALLFVLCASTDKAGITGEHEFYILPEGLQEETKANKTLIKWHGIKALRKTKKFILVQINAYLFHLIPRRSFDNQDSYDKFWTEIFTYHTAAKKNPQG